MKKNPIQNKSNETLRIESPFIPENQNDTEIYTDCSKIESDHFIEVNGKNKLTRETSTPEQTE